MYEIRMFGGLEVRTRGVRLARHDFGGMRERHILALLALHRTVCGTDLADLLWDGSPPGDHAMVVQRHVSELCARLDPDGRTRRPVAAVVSAGETRYRLDPDLVRTDVALFDELVTAATGRAPGRAVPPLTAAAHLAARPLLDGEQGFRWATEARAHYRNRLIEALLGTAERALMNDDPGAALELATQLLAVEPCAERGWFVTVAAHRVRGERVAALHAYEECRRRLVGTLAVEPSPPVRALFLTVLRDGGSPLDGVEATRHGVGHRAVGTRRPSTAGRRSGASTVVEG